MSSFLLSVCLLWFACFNSVTAGGAWSYDTKTGPGHWCEASKGCCGTKQSPIDLNLKSKVTNEKPLVLENYYIIATDITIENNGHSVAGTLSSPLPRTISGGGLPATYVFNNFHFHWGSNSGHGSEHTLYGNSYPMELHLVHYNSKFADLGAAIASGESDALAVIGVMYYLSYNANPALDNIVPQLKDVTYFGQKLQLTSGFGLIELLPVETRFFFRYGGSLTTPGCNEDVVWTVFLNPVPISESQLNAFRGLLSSSEGAPAHKMMDNFRPVQPLGERQVQIIVTPD